MAAYTPPIIQGVYARDFTAGDYYTFDEAGSDTTLVTTAGRLVVAAFNVYAPRSFDQWSIEVTAVAASSVFRAGIYRYARGRPNALVVDLGTIDSAAATGIITSAITLTLPPGRYALGGAAQGGTPTVRAKGSPRAREGQTSGGNVNTSGWTEDSVTGALPATLSLTQYQGNVPKVMLRAA